MFYPQLHKYIRQGFLLNSCYFINRCKCGNCSREFLCNAHECVCCTEIEECEQALNSDLVVDDVNFVDEYKIS